MLKLDSGTRANCISVPGTDWVMRLLGVWLSTCEYDSLSWRILLSSVSRSCSLLGTDAGGVSGRHGNSPCPSASLETHTLHSSSDFKLNIHRGSMHARTIVVSDDCRQCAQSFWYYSHDSVDMPRPLVWIDHDYCTCIIIQRRSSTRVTPRLGITIHAMCWHASMYTGSIVIWSC